MNTPSTPRDKTTKPHAHFDAPGEVVADPALSKAQKAAALDSLEQDARQMAVASAEGMSGGESGKLHDVLEAKGALELPPVEYAYGLVVQDLQSRRAATPAGAAHTALDQALAALQGVMRLPPPAVAQAVAAEARAEAEEEIAREKLDP
jgi:hypothetical protein